MVGRGAGFASFASGSSITVLAITPPGTRVIAGTSAGPVHLLELCTHEQPRAHRPSTSPLTEVCVRKRSSVSYSRSTPGDRTMGADRDRRMRPIAPCSSTESRLRREAAVTDTFLFIKRIAG